MIYLLDTSAISALIREDPPMKSWLLSLSAEDRVVTCTVARGEILFGLERLAQGRRRTDLEGKAAGLFASMPCESAPTSAAERYASLKVTQQRSGLPLDENDLWIAATASAIGAVLVTLDSDFAKIQGLSVIRP